MTYTRWRNRTATGGSTRPTPTYAPGSAGDVVSRGIGGLRGGARTPTFKLPEQKPPAGTQEPQWGPGTPEGYGEQWYKRNAWRWDQPTQQSQYWNSVKGWFNTPGAGETNLGRIAGDIERPGEFDAAWSRISGEMYNPGASESFYAKHGQDILKGRDMGRSAVGDYWQDTRGQFGAPGYMEQRADDLYGRALGPGSLQTNAHNVLGEIGNARNTQGFLDRSMSYLGGPGFTERAAFNYTPERGYSEGLMQTGAGLDSLYDRLYQRGSERLGNEAAARGGYNSGAALRATQELGADLTADQIRQTIALADQADRYRMQERGFGLDVARAGDEGARGRIGLGFEGSRSADDVALGRADSMRGLYKDIDDIRLRGVDLAGRTAKDAQASALDRLLGGAKVADMASADEVARFTARSNDDVNRFRAGSDSARNAQEGERNRRRDIIDSSERLDRLNLDRRTEAGDMYKDAQALALQRILAGITGSGQVDSTERDWLTGAQDAANSAQDKYETRQRNDFIDALALGGAQAQSFLSGMDPARREQFQSQMHELRMQLEKGNINAEQYYAQAEQLMATFGIAAGAAGGFATGVPTPPPTYRLPPSSGPTYRTSGPSDDDDVYRPY